MTIATLFAATTWGTAAEAAVVSQQLVNHPKLLQLKNALGGIKPWEARESGAPDFVCEATTDSSETGQVMDLTDLGLSLKAGYVYPVKLRYYAQDAEDRWFFERHYSILGGTTPVITGGNEIVSARGLIAGAAVDYGCVKASYTVTDGALAAIVAAQSSAGTTLADLSSGNGVITHPIARATVGVRALSAHFAADVETIGERREVQIASQTTATTSTLSMATVNGTEAVGVPTDDGELTFQLYIEPPPNGFLTMNSNNVEAHVSMDASDNVRHRLEVFIGQPQAVPFIT